VKEGVVRSALCKRLLQGDCAASPLFIKACQPIHFETTQLLIGDPNSRATAAVASPPTQGALMSKHPPGDDSVGVCIDEAVVIADQVSKALLDDDDGP